MAESWPGARKLCLFYRPWQLTGYWEQRPNDTATQQISTSSASCSSEQIQSLPPLRYNRADTAKQPPAKKAPTHVHRKTSWSGLSLGHSCIKGSFPSPWPTPTPIGKMCVFQVSKYCHLPESSMASPFGGGWWVGVGGLRIAPACFATEVHVASHSNQSIGWVRGILQAQLESANQTYLYSSSAFSQTRKPFPAFISSLRCFYNKRVSWCSLQQPHT